MDPDHGGSCGRRSVMERLFAIGRCLDSHPARQHGGRSFIAGAWRVVRGRAPIRMEAHRYPRPAKVTFLKVGPFPTTLESLTAP